MSGNPSNIAHCHLCFQLVHSVADHSRGNHVYARQRFARTYKGRMDDMYSRSDSESSERLVSMKLRKIAEDLNKQSLLIKDRHYL